MADEKTTKTEMEELAKEAKDATKEVNSLNRAVSRLNSRSLDAVAKKMGLVGSETKQTAEIFEKTKKDMLSNMSELEKAVGLAMTSNKKATLAATISLQSYVRQGEKAKDMLAATNAEIAESSEEFKTLSVSIFNTRKRLQELAAAKNKDTGYTAEQASEIAKLNERLQEQEQQYAAVATKVQAAAEASERYKQTILDSTKQGLEEVETLRMRNHELTISQGGVRALGGQINKVKDGRLFKFAQDLMSGAAASALFAISVAKLNKMLAETGDYAKAAGQVALSMGKSPNLSFSDSFSKASEAAASLMETSGSLGMKLEEVSEAANKIRLGIRADKDGVLSEQAIAGLTLEAAKFSKVAGVDLSTSVELLDKRIKRFGMTSSEAQQDLMNMRVTLGQMAAGNKANAVSMSEMIDIIEEASSASQSYVVDTRMMTQALRGAVNQATLLGASQKEAKDIAKATGKIFSSAPDWVKIPAGHNLLDKLVGGDSDKFIGRFNSATQKRLQELRSAVRSGQVGSESASRELFDLIGSTEAGQEAQFKQMKNVLFTMSADGTKIIERSKDAAMIIKQEFGLENMAQAGLLTRMMQDAAEMQDMVYQDALKQGMDSKQAEDFANKTIPFSQALAKQTATFNDSIETALKNGENAVEVLKKQGASQKAAENYVKFYKDKADLEKAYQAEVEAVENDRFMEQGAKERKLRDLKKKHFEEYTKEQMKLSLEAIDPVRAAMNEMGLDNESIKFDVGDFEKIGIKNAKQLAEHFGITGSQNVKELEKLYSSTNEEDRKVAMERISQMRTSDAKAAKEQEEYLNSFTTKLSDGFLGAFSHIINKFLGSFGIAGPKLAAWTAGLTAGLAGLALVLGPKILGWVIKRATRDGVIEGMAKAKFPGAGDDNDRGTPEEWQKKKRENRAERNKKARGLYTERAKKAFGRGLGQLKTSGSRLEGLKSLGQASKSLGKGFGLAGKRLPGIGSLLSVGYGAMSLMSERNEIDARTDISAAEKSNLKNKALTNTAGSTIGTLGGGALGMALAGPLGAMVGAAVGEKLGGMAGDFAGDLYNKFTMPQAPVASITGAATAMAVPSAPPGAAGSAVGSPGASQIARAMAQGGSGGLASLAGQMQATPQMGGVSPDGSVTLKIHNFLDLLSGAKSVAARSNTPLFGS